MRCVSCLGEEFHEESWLPGVFRCSSTFRIRNRPQRDDSVCSKEEGGWFSCAWMKTPLLRPTIEWNSQLFLRSSSAVEKGITVRDEREVGTGQRKNGLVLPTSPLEFSHSLAPEDAIAASFLRTFVKSSFEFRRYRWWCKDILFYSILFWRFVRQNIAEGNMNYYWL